MKPWGPSWLKLQTEFYPTGFLQARVRQSWEGGGGREGEEREERGREGVVCVYTGWRRGWRAGGVAPPTPAGPSEPE